ncbi:MAG: hypothetical protein WC765_03010 [Phycisphaerae bacterium]|jgi:hypothetical protein
MTQSDTNRWDLGSNLADKSDEQLAILRASLRSEMRKRGIADSVGAVGELLAIEHFRKTSGLPKLQSAPRGTKNVDALSRNGERFSIKTVCEGSKTGTIYPDPSDRDKQLFEFILILKLAEDWSLRSIHQLSWHDFLKVRSWDKRMNAWYVAISARSLAVATVVFQAP